MDNTPIFRRMGSRGQHAADTARAMDLANEASLIDAYEFDPRVTEFGLEHAVHMGTLRMEVIA